MIASMFQLVRAATVLAAALVIAACGRTAAENNADQSPPEVLTVQPKLGESVVELRLPARMMAGESARLYARASGFVSAQRADIGDRVEADQVLAVISTPEIDEAVREAAAVLAKAQADEELAKMNFKRAEALIGPGAISEETHNERKAKYGVAVAATRAAKARLAAASERQSFQSVRAPFAGTVVARNVDRGDRVVADASSATPMFVINSLDPLRVVIDVPQNVALQIKPGLEGIVSFAELPAERFDARVTRSAQAISAEAGVMRAELRLPNPGERIPSGMLGTVTLRLPRAEPPVLIPTSAVTQSAGVARVAILQNSILEYRKVTLGRNLGDTIEVLSGLAIEDKVVLSPNALLDAGSKVTATEVIPEKRF